MIDRHFGLDRRKSVAVVLGISLLLVAFLAAYFLTGTAKPAAGQPLRDLAVLVDPAGTETIASVSAPAALGRFKPVKGDFSAGYTRNVHWLRFTAQAPVTGLSLLEARPATLDDLRLFEPTSGGFIEHHTGDRQAFAKRELNSRNLIFKLELPDIAPRTFYLRIETSGRSKVWMSLWQPDALQERDVANAAGLGFYFGLAALLFALNLVLWLRFRRQQAAWLSLHVLGHAMTHFGFYGLASKFIVPAVPEIGDGWSVIGLMLYLSSLAPLYQHMLRLNATSGWSRVLFRIQFALPWLMFPAYFSDHLAAVTSLVDNFSTFFAVWLLSLSLRFWIQGRVEVVWLFLSILFALAGPGLYALGVQGWFAGSYLSTNFHLYGSLSTMMALQLALTAYLKASREKTAIDLLRGERAERLVAVEQSAKAQLQSWYDEKVGLLVDSERQGRLLRRTLRDLHDAQRLGKIGLWETKPPTWDLTAMSDETSRIFGASAQRPVTSAEDRRRCFVPESWQRLQVAVKESLISDNPYVIELELLPAAGAAQWIEMRGRAERDESGQVIKGSGTVQDITERRLLQETTAAGIVESIANRSRSEFLARVSHELRTPLNAVMGFSQLLALEPAVRAVPAIAEQVELIHGAADHLKSMIDDVLDLAQIQSGGLRLMNKDCSVGPLAAECLSWLEPQAEARKVSLHLNGQDRVCLAVADHRRLRQILINLLSNAIKYNRIGGAVWLSLCHEPGSDASIAGWICMAVSDTGPGLTHGQIDSLYQPFNRLGAELSEVEGTGLGLAVARDLAEGMGGSLQVQSEPGKGSTFTLRLVAAESEVVVPGGNSRLAARQNTAGASDAEPADAIQIEKHRDSTRPFVVLYVEDNRLNVMVMRHAIKRLPGVRLEVATDGGTGLALAQRLRPDLLLLDMNMPVLSGIEVMQRVRADPALEKVPCVAVSANSLPEDIERAIALGFDDYITKPFAVARVLELVERLRRDAGLRLESLQFELLEPAYSDVGDAVKPRPRQRLEADLQRR